jgi:putative lysine/arginine/ornithine/histidine/octopine transport system permease protein
MSTLYAFGNQLLQGAALTLTIAMVSALLGCILGLVGAVMKLSGRGGLIVLAETYTTLIRGVPDLLMIFIIYFGGTVLLTKLLGRYVDIDPFTAGSTALALVFGGYATEIFRGAILAVPEGQSEGAKAVGLRSGAIFFLVVLPQAARFALPPLGNLSIVMLKQTSLVSVVGLEELMRKATIAAGATGEPFIFFAAAAFIYLVMTSALTWGLHVADARARRGLARA